MVLDSRDPALTGSEQPAQCLKTCGSKRCKQAIKSNTCKGIQPGACISAQSHTATDRIQANKWLDREKVVWLNHHGKRVPKSHLTITASLMPA